VSNATPNLTIANHADGGHAYTESGRYFPEQRTGFPHGEYLHDVIFREFRVPMLTPSRRFPTEMIEGMFFVLALGQIFQVLGAVVCFLAILVVYRHFGRARPYERFGNQAVNKESLCVSLILQHYASISASITITGHELYSLAADISKVGNPVQSFVTFYGEPMFMHVFDYTGMTGKLQRG